MSRDKVFDIAFVAVAAIALMAVVAFMLSGNHKHRDTDGYHLEIHNGVLCIENSDAISCDWSGRAG
jgi:hypothetical protein